MPARVGSEQVKDESFHRTGWVLAKPQTEEMLEIAHQAKEAIHKKNVEFKKKLSLEILEEHLDMVRGVVTKNYPGYHGLGEWEPVRVLLESDASEIVDAAEVGAGPG